MSKTRRPRLAASIHGGEELARCRSVRVGPGWGCCRSQPARDRTYTSPGDGLDTDLGGVRSSAVKYACREDWQSFGDCVEGGRNEARPPPAGQGAGLHGVRPRALIGALLRRGQSPRFATAPRHPHPDVPLRPRWRPRGPATEEPPSPDTAWGRYRAPPRPTGPRPQPHHRGLSDGPLGRRGRA